MCYCRCDRASQPWVADSPVLLWGRPGLGDWYCITPLDTAEKQRFTDFATAVSAFVSGFVIAKLGVIADQLVGKLVETGGEVLLFRTLLFGTCLLIGFLFPFINRLYLQPRLYLQQTPGKSPAP